ncbi:MAG: amino acid--tRNA ligase-related protein, partial [Microthrixaceae bacterium]
FTEVETPVLSASAGGAVARPFVTHHNALGVDLHLRVAPELALKRLVVGGMDRVFELGRVFRNEGIDTTHNPEFTILEAYQSPGDVTDMMDLVEGLVVAAARAANGTTEVDVAGTTVDLAEPWRRVAMAELVREVTGVELRSDLDPDEARGLLAGLGVATEPGWGAGRCLAEAFERFVEHTLARPTIVFDHPRETSPLARARPDDPTTTERFEVIVGGRELANAYSELNDPDEQRRRMAAGTPDGSLAPGDEEFVEALEAGLSPTGGLGVGVDRLVMLLTGASSIRDVVLFPALRPRRGRDRDARALSPVVPTTPLPTSVRPGAPVAFVRLSGLVRVVATLTTVVGVLIMLTALPRLGGRFLLLEELVTPVPKLVGDEALPAAVLGLVMVLLAGQLLRGKRRAWTFALVLFVASAVVSLIRGGEAVALVTSLSMVAILLATRNEFTGLQDPPSVLQVARLVPRYLLFVYGFGLVAIWTQRNRLEPPFSWGRSVEAVTLGLFGIDGPYVYRGRFGTWFPIAMVVLGAIGLLLLLWLLLRPAVRPPDRQGRARAEELMERHGWDTLAPFTLRPDRNHFFSSDGEAMVAYGYLGGYALMTGDPVGATASVPLVVDEFMEYCRRHGWQPAVLAAREIDAPFWAERGFRSFYLGDEAVLDCRTFDLDAPGMGPVRQSVRRVEGDHTYELLSEADAGPALAAELDEISRRWRRGEDERGYTMAMSQGVGGTDPTRLLAVARRQGPEGPGPPVAFLRLIPTGDREGPYGPGYTLDLMRRLPDSANGIVEFLIARTAAELDGRGVPRLSLNFAVMSRLLDDDVPLGRGERVLRRLVEALNPYYQIRSLREFNEKFHPEWLPRVLVYAEPADLPKVALRYAWLEGFVDVPLLGRLLSGPASSEVASVGDRR